MDASRFCLWLSGYFELRDEASRKNLTAAQADLIRTKLAQVEGLNMAPPVTVPSEEPASDDCPE